MIDKEWNRKNFLARVREEETNNIKGVNIDGENKITWYIGRNK